MADSGASAGANVKSAMRTLDILEFVVAQRRPMAAHEIATALSIPVSSLSYLLTTLVDRGYLARDGRRYSPGAGLARLQAAEPAFELADRVAPLVRMLRVQLNETASFFVLRDWQVEALASEIGVQALRYSFEVGQRAPLHAFAAGKALLAALPAAELDAYLDQATLPAFTPATITSKDRLRAEIDEVRRTGIGRTREEHTPGIFGLARVVEVGGVPAGALSVAIPAPRFTTAIEARVIDLLTRAAGLLADTAVDARPMRVVKG